MQSATLLDCWDFYFPDFLFVFLCRLHTCAVCALHVGQTNHFNGLSYQQRSRERSPWPFSCHSKPNGAMAPHSLAHAKILCICWWSGVHTPCVCLSAAPCSVVSKHALLLISHPQIHELSLSTVCSFLYQVLLSILQHVWMVATSAFAMDIYYPVNHYTWWTWWCVLKKSSGKYLDPFLSKCSSFWT